MWVPPDHDLLKIGLALWAFSAIAATKEYYEYLSNPYCYKFGPFLWLTCMTLFVEYSIMIKFGLHMFTEPFPLYVKVIWSIIGIFVLVGGIYSWINENKNKQKEE